mmetsp:Transcript_10311/g.29356  ORF Transcript_10311/g.29356 Transcript_10311/m.29356 type:complete len:508 (-) Transcript_10311:35-1558(-)
MALKITHVTSRMMAALLFATVSFSIPNVMSFTLPVTSHSRSHNLARTSLTDARGKLLFVSVDDSPRTSSTPEKSGSSRRWKKRDSLAIHKLPKAAYRVYVSYVRRLWKETDVEARMEVANDKVKGAIRNMQHILSCNEYNALSEEATKSQEELLKACEKMLAALTEEEKQPAAEIQANALLDVASSASTPAKSKPRRSIMLGVLMGIAVACWVFSGNYLFTALFTLMTVLGQLEYYRMIMNTGVYPARRISVIGACSMFLTALFAPNLHQICLPMFGLWAMIWFLTMRQSYTTIPEIAATFTGMFYLGYVPSFWVRLRLIGSDMPPTRLYAILRPFRQYLKTKFGVLIPVRWIQSPITVGSVFIFWSWLSLAFSDVGAYFVGRKFGKTKLSAISPAAGATSPNKTVEGVIGGCAASALLSIIGAWVQKWPYFVVTGAVHGLCLGLLGLIGDLTASMLKRDAGIKDFGDLIPEHGGILDRVDSFVWTAPYSWLVCAYVIPALKKVAGV